MFETYPKTTMNKQVVQNLLKDFWNNTKEDYKHNPVLFNLVKNTIVEINQNLKETNGRKEIPDLFVQIFLSKFF